MSMCTGLGTGFALGSKPVLMRKAVGFIIAMRSLLMMSLGPAGHDNDGNAETRLPPPQWQSRRLIRIGAEFGKLEHIYEWLSFV